MFPVTVASILLRNYLSASLERRYWTVVLELLGGRSALKLPERCQSHPGDLSDVTPSEALSETLRVRLSGAGSLGVSIFKAPGQPRGGARLESPFVVVLLTLLVGEVRNRGSE